MVRLGLRENGGSRRSSESVVDCRVVSCRFYKSAISSISSLQDILTFPPTREQIFFSTERKNEPFFASLHTSRNELAPNPPTPTPSPSPLLSLPSPPRMSSSEADEKPTKKKTKASPSKKSPSASAAASSKPKKEKADPAAGSADIRSFFVRFFSLLLEF